MAPPYDPTDPRTLTPEQRLKEVASLLATGVRRLAAVRAVSAPRHRPRFLWNAPEMDLMCPRKRGFMYPVVIAICSPEAEAGAGVVGLNRCSLPMVRP